MGFQGKPPIEGKIGHSAIPAAVSRVLSKRNTPFTPHEIARFITPIRAFFANLPVDGRYQAGVRRQILTAERAAMLEVGKSTDFNKMRACRRRAIELLEKDPEARKDYVDMLLSLARVHFVEREYGDAEAVLSAVLDAESQQNNWHALVDLALVLGVQGRIPQALEYFEKARQSLGSYRFEVGEVEKWEADVSEAQFKLAADPSPGREKLEQILRPVFQVPEGVEEKAAPLDSLSAMPARLSETLGRMAEMEGIEPSVALAVLQSMDGAGQGAAALYSYFRIDRTLRIQGTRGEKDARALYRDVHRRKILTGRSDQGIKKYIDERLEIEKSYAATTAILDLLDEIREGKKNLSEGLAKRVESEFGKIDENSDGELKELKQSVREEIAAVIKERLGTSGWEAAVRFAEGLFNLDEELTQGITNVFGERLGDSAFRTEVRAGIIQIRRDIEVTAKSVAEKRNPAASMAHPEPMLKNSDFIARQRMHDFFFVRLRSLAAVREIYREVAGIPWAEPASLASVWFERLTPYAASPQQRIKLLDRAIAEDAGNMVAEVDLGRAHWNVGDYSASERVNRRILEATDNPAVKVVVYSIQIARVVVQAKKASGPQRSAAEAEEIFPRAKEAYAQLEPARQVSVLEEWTAILRNMAHLNSVVHHFEEAEKYYRLILEFDAADEMAVVGMGLDFMKRGEFERAVVHFAQGGIKSKGSNDTFYYLAAEALLRNGDVKRAEQYANLVLGRSSKHLDCLLTKARIFVFTERIDQAEPLVNQAEEWAKKHLETSLRPEDYPHVSRRVEGVVASIRAEILMRRNQHKDALASYQKAAAVLSRDFDSEYYEIESRSRLSDAMAKIASEEITSGNEERTAKGIKIMQDALSEGAKLVQKYPFFPLAHECVVAPLITLGKDREALEHFRWLVENIGSFSIENLANLVIFAWNEEREGEIRAEARRLIFVLRDKFGAEPFRGPLQKAVELARQHNPGLTLHQELSAIL